MIARKTKLLNPLCGQTLVKTETGIWNVKYNCENRPVKFINQENGNYLTMAYDYQGRRFEKASYSSAGVLQKREKLVYRDFLQIMAFDATEENLVHLSSTFWNPLEPTATQPLAITAQTQAKTYYFTHDLTKNVCELLTETGEIAESYDYSPFGRRSQNSETVSENLDNLENFTNPFQFSSEYYDSELNLVYYNYRHYNPTDGRWETKSRYKQASPARSDRRTRRREFVQFRAKQCG
ncbi:MAG: RHS repeat domain-containing protein [Lentisphaeria bacterium]